MTDLFESVVLYVIKNEGGYAEPPMVEQPTKWGITLTDLEHFRGETLTAEDLKAMTIGEAKTIYFLGYWKPMSCEKIISAPVATCIMDSGVLYGTSVGVLLAQLSLNLMGVPVKPDSYMGPETLKALTLVDVDEFVGQYVGCIIARIGRIVGAHPEDKKYQDGWVNRAQRLLTLVSH